MKRLSLFSVLLIIGMLATPSFAYHFEGMTVGSTSGSTLTWAITCVNNTTAHMNWTFFALPTGVGAVFQKINTTDTILCPNGCDNSTRGYNRCRPPKDEANLFGIVGSLSLLGLAFLLLYIGVNMKEYRTLQFLFLGMALMIMIAQGWFVEFRASHLITDTNPVFASVYLLLIVVMLIVILYFIFSLIAKSLNDAKERKTGLDLMGSGAK